MALPFVSDVLSVLLRASNALSAASMPVFMALCDPLTFGTFMKPGLQPIRAPPGNAIFGILCKSEAHTKVMSKSEALSLHSFFRIKTGTETILFSTCLPEFLPH